MSVGGMKPCCASGSLHTGTPTGRESTLHGFNTYIAEPEGGLDAAKGVVVIIPDIFGWEFLNNRVLADDYARKGGFLVLLPDFMDGYVVPESLLTSIPALNAKGFLASIKKVYHILRFLWWIIPCMVKNKASVATPRIQTFFRGLKKSHPDLPVGAAGFCWGGQHVIKLCHETTDPLIDCGFTAHPSLLSYPTDIEAVELPLSIAAAGDHDPQMSRKQGELTKKILEAKNKRDESDVGGDKHEFVWYEGAKHGFAVRAEEDDLEESERGKKAEEQALKWFGRWFAVAAAAGAAADSGS